MAKISARDAKEVERVKCKDDVQFLFTDDGRVLRKFGRSRWTVYARQVTPENWAGMKQILKDAGQVIG